MMLVLFLTIALVAVAMGAMAIGVALTGRRLKGSCGGVGNNCECLRAGLTPDRRSCNRLH